MRNLLWLMLAFFLPFSTVLGQEESLQEDTIASHLITEGTGQVSVRNLRSINTPQLEFSPTYYRDGIVFVTSRQRGGYYDPKINSTYFELFYAKLNEDGTPYQPRPFSLEINTKYHEGPVSFTKDARRMYFSRNNIQDGVLVKSKEGNGKTQIFEAYRGIFDWEDIQPLPFNLDDFNSMHPSINREGTKLYFASDRPGGFGGMDIYVVDWLETKWSEPVNLGPDVNTPGNEVFPFIHDSGVLFVASDGQKGLGGLDLYLIDISGRQWGQLINLGKPFNSEADDFGFVMNSGGTQGFFTSARTKGKGKDDLYLFTASDGIEGIKVAKQVLAKVSVLDQESRKPLVGAKVRVFERLADGTIGDGDIYNMEIVPTDSTNSSYQLVERRKSEVQLGAPKALVNEQGVAIIPLNPRKQYTVLVDREGYKSVEQSLDVSPTDTYYELELGMEKMECLGLTGAIRSAGYNKPIPNARIAVASSCDPDIELLRTNEDGEFEYCLESNCTFQFTASKAGFSDEVKQLSTVALRGASSFDLDFLLFSQVGERTPPKPSETTSEKSSSQQLLAQGKIIYLEGIAYDFNKSAIRSGAARDLDAVAKLMDQFSSLRIEIGAHTDSRGTDEYNLALSNARALYAKDYLIEKGISSRRIQTKGYGESQPRNNCVDGVRCAESEHKVNRRLEIKILKINESVDLQVFNEEIKNQEE